MAKLSQAPKVYADSCIFLHVIKKESGLWPDSLKVLMAAERGDIRLVASTLVLAEVGSSRGDVQPRERDAVIHRYLENLPVEWCEVDLFTVEEARRLCDPYNLRGADAVHLATALRRKVAYFMSRDKAYPYGHRFSTGTEVCHPMLVWDPTVDDSLVDMGALSELADGAGSSAAQPPFNMIRRQHPA